MGLNENLKKLRIAKKLNQEEMAKILEVSLSSYQKYERDKNSITPSLDVLLRISDFHNVSLDYLLGRDTKEPKPIEQFAKQFNLSANEKSFIDNFLSLAPDERDILINAMRKIVR